MKSNKDVVNEIPWKSHSLNIKGESSLIHKLSKLSIDDENFAAEFPALLPKRLINAPIVYICPKCYGFFENECFFREHKTVCIIKEDEGTLIYSGEFFAVFEICGAKYVDLAFQLSLFANLLMYSKSADTDVAIFDFYVVKMKLLNRLDFVGYFSKRKEFTVYNLNMMVVLPPYRQCGIGRYIAEMSYLFKERMNKPGTPKRPFTITAYFIYEAFWQERLAGAVLRLADKTDNYSGRQGRRDIMHTAELVQESHLMEHDLRIVTKSVGLSEIAKDVWEVKNFHQIEILYKRGFEREPRPKMEFFTSSVEVDELAAKSELSPSGLKVILPKK